MPAADKKLWNWQSAILDHVRVLVRIPVVLFLSPFLLTAKQMEAIQVGVSNTNASNISKVWHKGFQRMAKFDNSRGVEVFDSYGRSFGLSDGAGTNTWALYDEIEAGHSLNVARAAEAVAFMQLWMDLVGNTIGAFLRGSLKCKGREEQSVIFEIIFFLLYFPEYFLMAFGAVILRVLPANDLMYKLAFFVHCIVATLLIFPIGILGLLLLPIYIIASIDASTLPSRMGYEAIPGDEIYTVTVVKPAQAQKVGIRFGANTSGQVVITNIKPLSIAATTRLQIGDVVVSINGKPVTNIMPRQAASTLMEATGSVAIQALSNDGTIVTDEDTV